MSSPRAYVTVGQNFTIGPNILGNIKGFTIEGGYPVYTHVGKP